MQHIDLGDAVLPYEIIGSGPTLLTLHGGPGLDHSYLRPWLDPLADRFEIVYFDQRGSGGSTSESSLATVTHASWAQDVDTLCERLGRARVVLFGHSYGAFLALETALRHPERLDGLILSNVAAVIDYPDVIMQRVQETAPPDVLQAFLSRFGRPLASDADLKEMFSSIAQVYFHRFDPSLAAQMMDRIQFRAEAYNRGATELLPAFNALPRLGEIDVPTLIVAGRHDTFCPVDRGPARVQNGIRGSRLVVLEESGHFPFIEEHDAFLAAVRTFADGLRATG